MAAAEPALSPTDRFLPLLLVFPAVASLCAPELAGLMIYDRVAILHGELWRLVTGHWVHFSAAHLVCDAAVLGTCSWLVSRRGFRRFPAVCLLTGLAIGLALLVGQPGLARYGGLSGLAMTGLMLAGLLELQASRLRSGFGLGLLALAAGRLLADLVGGGFLFTGLAALEVRPVPLSHALGALGGLAAFAGWGSQVATPRPGAVGAPADSG